MGSSEAISLGDNVIHSQSYCRGNVTRKPAAAYFIYCVVYESFRIKVTLNLVRV